MRFLNDACWNTDRCLQVVADNDRNCCLKVLRTLSGSVRDVEFLFSSLLIMFLKAMTEYSV